LNIGKREEFEKSSVCLFYDACIIAYTAIYFLPIVSAQEQQNVPQQMPERQPVSLSHS
jgi:hypothetical protein